MSNNNLQTQLSHRPTPEELLNTNILKAEPNLAPALQSASVDLELALRMDSLSRSLSDRADKSSLIERGVLKDVKVAPNLVAAAVTLEQEQNKDSLKRQMSLNRGRNELIEQNIIKDMGSIAPSLHPAAKELEKAFVADSINQHLQKRAAAQS